MSESLLITLGERERRRQRCSASIKSGQREMWIALRRKKQTHRQAGRTVTQTLSRKATEKSPQISKVTPPPNQLSKASIFKRYILFDAAFLPRNNLLKIFKRSQYLLYLGASYTSFTFWKHASSNNRDSRSMMSLSAIPLVSFIFALKGKFFRKS